MPFVKTGSLQLFDLAGCYETTICFTFSFAIAFSFGFGVFNGVRTSREVFKRYAALASTCSTFTNIVFFA